MDALQNIARDRKNNLWVVSKGESGSPHSVRKEFRDTRYGGHPATSLAFAVDWRNENLDVEVDLGVALTRKGRYWQWQAYWNDVPGGPQQQRYFSVNKWGYEGALERAADLRATYHSGMSKDEIMRRARSRYPKAEID